ncbi:MAG TPA: hypothetical protein VKE74_07075 [Gemmataceae bacterium]|nr:hypothetical protein [Gemmataceae bacterium]
MNEQTPYVVDNKWIVYARNTMEATIQYRSEVNPNKWPIVRQAHPADLTRLPVLSQTSDRRAA